jgi:NAD(P)H-nitrite reductase large subunit
MALDRCVIIGNGPAAYHAALTLREKAPEVRVTILGQEPVPHYKPHLLPDFIAGKVSEEDLFVKPLAFYKDLDVKLRLCQKVVDVDFSLQQVVLEHKETIPFDGLIIACGGIPRIPEPLWMFSDVMLTLKTLADARVWIETLAKVESVLVVGGDLTSFAFVKALLSLGKSVHFMIDEDAFWPVRRNEHVLAQARATLNAKGVQVIEGRRILGITCVAENVFEVTTDRHELQVGAVGAFFGLVPNVKFLVRSGLHIERGVLVDEHLRTRFENVYAAGDCAQVFHPGFHDYWVSIGYKNACNLGRIAAANLIGGSLRADVAPASIFHLDEIAVNTSWWTEFS